ncbi:hypothetical protein AX774_g6598 [Zancudomyces culisetae]|uniref:Uncharacterized protein n=1 Tax=Zancudomyces culisetae TaxID=1213189 RepID=A0A1R1PGK3_ZANCU|nr:hypothetical protein AX774_g6598 [Zancudomyces culisetae]|eukprot:OMH79982.1 hypothetical protein AX774_g6598 [Zancudomyces culisetae]
MALIRKSAQLNVATSRKYGSESSENRSYNARRLQQNTAFSFGSGKRTRSLDYGICKNKVLLYAQKHVDKVTESILQAVVFNTQGHLSATIVENNPKLLIKLIYDAVKDVFISSTCLHSKAGLFFKNKNKKVRI